VSDGTEELAAAQRIQRAAEDICQAEKEVRSALEGLHRAASRANAATAAIEEWADTALSDALAPTCPTCGSAAVLRSGAHGVFYGCTQYPRCTGILDVAVWRARAKHALAERIPGAGKNLEIPPAQVATILGGERIPWEVFMVELRKVFENARTVVGSDPEQDAGFERARLHQLEQSVMARVEATRCSRKTVDLPAMHGGYRRSKKGKEQ